MYMNGRSRSAVRTVSFTSLTLIQALRGSSGCIWSVTSSGNGIFFWPFFPLISHTLFSGTLEQELACKICSALCLVLFAPQMPLEKKLGNNIFKTMTGPSEVNRRKAFSCFSSIKPQQLEKKHLKANLLVDK